VARVGWVALILAIGVGIGFYMSDGREGPARPDGLRLGVSYDQALRHLGDQFAMEKAALADGRERWIGTSGEVKATVELIGEAADLSRAALVIWMPLDAEHLSVYHRNRVVLFRFLDDTTPEIRGQYSWRSTALDQFREGTSTLEEKVVAGRQIRLRFEPESEMVHAFVEPLGQ